MSTDAVSTHTMHAGRLIARRLKASGVDTIFTLSGGHLFSVYDGCRDEGIRLIDTRPRHGSMGASIAFLHPADLGGVLTELVQPSPRDAS